MSVSSMANMAYARRHDVKPVGEGLETTAKVAQATGQNIETSTPTTSAISSMAAYIPTEVITVYVAVLAAIGTSAPAPGSQSTATVTAMSLASPFPLYILFIILVPVIVWGLYAGTVKAAKKPIPKSIGAWPKWEMFAGTIAFAIWAAALPNSPLSEFSWFSAAVAGIAALVISMLIGVFAPLFASNTLKDS
jgi:hypothetical protein